MIPPPRDVEAIHRSALALLPPGWIWPRGTDDQGDGLLAAIVQAFAEGLHDAEALAAAMMRETDPRTAMLSLSDFERVLGPDPCLPNRAQLPIPDRQKIAHARWTARGGASIPYFLGLAAALGYEGVTIDEWRPFVMGWSRCGDARWGLGHPKNRYYWRVNVPGARLTWFRCGAGRCGQDTHLRIARAEDLECTLRRLKPSQSEIVFNYHGT